MRVTRLAALALALAAAPGTACVPDGPHGPAVYNALSSDVYIELQVDNGAIHRFPIEAGVLAYVGNPPLQVRSVTVKDRDGAILYAWSEDELRRLAGRRRVDRRGIVIDEDGLRLVSIAEANELDRRNEE
jgi:hypothetical protein